MNNYFINDTEIKKELKSCPLCGNNHLEVNIRIMGCPPWTRIRCTRCNLILGNMVPEVAVETWNNRISEEKKQ